MFEKFKRSDENKAVEQARKKLKLLEDERTNFEYGLINYKHDMQLNEAHIDLQEMLVGEVERLEKEREKAVNGLEVDNGN